MLLTSCLRWSKLDAHLRLCMSLPDDHDLLTPKTNQCTTRCTSSWMDAHTHADRWHENIMYLALPTQSGKWWQQYCTVNNTNNEQTLVQCPLICNLHAPQRSPSISILRTHSSSLDMSVSSSQGFTSRMMFDLAIVTGSVSKQVTQSHYKAAEYTASTAIMCT